MAEPDLGLIGVLYGETPELHLVELLYGEHGVLYKPGTTLCDRAWVLAEIVRRGLEKAGHIVPAQNPFMTERAKQLVEQYERKKRGFLGSGVMSGELGNVGHD